MVVFPPPDSSEVTQRYRVFGNWKGTRESRVFIAVLNSRFFESFRLGRRNALYFVFTLNSSFIHYYCGSRVKRTRSTHSGPQNCDGVLRADAPLSVMMGAVGRIP